MVTEKICRQQANRLMRLPFALQDPEEAKAQRGELERVLKGRCLTDAHCTTVVDYLIEHASRCPPPAEVIEAIHEVPAPDKVKGPMGCEACRGSGFISFVRHVRLKNGMEYDADCARFCDCELGQFKAAAEARRNAEAAAKQGLRRAGE